MNFIKKYFYFLIGLYLVVILILRGYINDILIHKVITYFSLLLFLVIIYLMDKWELYGVYSKNTTKKEFRFRMVVISITILALLIYFNFIK